MFIESLYPSVLLPPRGYNYPNSSVNLARVAEIYSREMDGVYYIVFVFSRDHAGEWRYPDKVRRDEDYARVLEAIKNPDSGIAVMHQVLNPLPTPAPDPFVVRSAFEEQFKFKYGYSYETDEYDEEWIDRLYKSFKSGIAFALKHR